MIAWVCFQCPAHGLDTDGLLSHQLQHTSHDAAWILPRTSHRWATIHGNHPRLVKRNPCNIKEHLKALDAKERT